MQPTEINAQCPMVLKMISELWKNKIYTCADMLNECRKNVKILSEVQRTQITKAVTMGFAFNTKYHI